ncbi:MAG: Electron transfer flavoprotein subunit beta [Alphaproteobacteria bacterium MarineAlpha6_Bin4]|nr:MAG: Electron transfer flavoprotein subunit beta [Alphaproteobacteria bacterium MarineAlpha6_Bin3]PPR37762.1 MAG: Electron transfer flavoprotein subunit beta [Alphaproteobacteria bacterium MarineAlpha6_Bin4]|tara:strand:+ start:4112 stop:4861 length:750 start_codon:yes stop_codon:yes gene_type:complete
MKILVPVKRVVDYNVKIKVKSDNSNVDLENVKMSMNPFDEIAVEEAVRLKEKKLCNEIIAITIGSAKSEETLRTALAIGADKGILVETEEEVQPLEVAKILREIIKKNNPDLVLMGKQAIDDDSNQTGQMLSALLEWPQGTFASKLEINGKKLNVTREIDGGLETLEMAIPAIITTDLRLNEPRYASLPNIMKAKQKPIEKITPKDLNIEIKQRLKTLEVKEPPKKQAGIKIDSVQELVKKLHDEEKVI